MNYPKIPRRERNVTEDRMVQALDELAAYEEWTETVLPELKKDVKDGKTAPEMRAKYSALLTAKMISIGLTEPKAAAAIMAIKDVLDRDEGKPVETKEIKHRLEALPNEELDALLKTKLKDLGSTIDVTPLLPTDKK